jgi:hypothetical protein
MDKPTEKDKTMCRSRKYREIGLQVDVPTEDELLRIIRLFLRSIRDHNYELDLLAGEDDEFKAAVAKFSEQAADKFSAPKITKDGRSEEDIQRQEEYLQRVYVKHYISCALETAVAGKYNEGMNRQEIIAYFVERGLSPGNVNNLMRGIVPEEQQGSFLGSILVLGFLIVAAVIFLGPSGVDCDDSDVQTTAKKLLVLKFNNDSKPMSEQERLWNTLEQRNGGDFNAALNSVATKYTDTSKVSFSSIETMDKPDNLEDPSKYMCTAKARILLSERIAKKLKAYPVFTALHVFDEADSNAANFDIYYTISDKNGDDVVALGFQHPLMNMALSVALRTEKEDEKKSAVQ